MSGGLDTAIRNSQNVSPFELTAPDETKNFEQVSKHAELSDDDVSLA